jgi:2-polyprenyl-3-methyl-5-hydroxy-6-metoxy-1,4-benzoquinol methylase
MRWYSRNSVNPKNQIVEDRLFPIGTVPEWTKPEWHAERDRAPHLEQPGHTARLEKAAQLLARVWSPGMRVVDLGAGDGGLLSLLDIPPHAKWGYERGQDVRLGDCVAEEIQWGDIAITTEMLEHLIDPHRFLKTIRHHSEFLVASSPWNESKQQHYEFHTWAWNVQGYARLISEAGWQIIEHETVSAFQIILARKDAQFKSNQRR